MIARFWHRDTSTPGGVRSWEPELGATLKPTPKPLTKGPGRRRQGAGPPCQFVPRWEQTCWPDLFPSQEGFVSSRYLGKLKGLNEVQHAAVPWIHYLTRERAPALPPPPPPAPVGMAALMGRQGTQESALKGRMIGRLSTETIPTLSVQRSVCVLIIKITDPTLKNVNFQTEQEGLAGFCDMRPPRQPFQSLVLGGQEGQALNDPGCLQGT